MTYGDLFEEGRMIEMDEKESIRVTHVHENELAEMNRKKKMTVVQRIKVSRGKHNSKLIMNLKEIMEKRQQLEEENESESEEEDEWEAMEVSLNEY